MSGVLDYWALLNTVVIMLGLGMAPAKGEQHGGWWPLLRVLAGYNLLLPLLVWLLVRSLGWLSADALAAMILCIACAGGTSAGAFVTQVKGSVTLAATLIVWSLVLSLASIALFSQWQWIQPGALSLSQLALYLLAITLLPLLAGRGLRRVVPALCTRWQPRIERLGSLLVVLLVIALAVRYGREILTGPGEPLWAAAVLVLAFVLPPLLEVRESFRRTVVLVTLIRNLTLVLSLLAVLPDAPALIPTVLAFGLFMYAMTGLLVWRWRTR